MIFYIDIGILATSTPKNQEKNEMELATKEMIDPIVAYSRPPRLPPVIGPLVALSLLDTWWNWSSDDDGKWCEISYPLLKYSFRNKHSNTECIAKQSYHEAP